LKQKTLAIPIRLVNYSDSSQVLTLFTRDFGLLSAIAKGAHRERNNFQGPFDLGMVWEVVFVERPAERGLSILTEGTLLRGCRGARRRWERWAGAAYLIEYLRVVGVEGQPGGELFDLAAQTLLALARPGPAAGPEAEPEGVAVSRALLCFEARALRILGLSAPAAACVECGRPWSRSERPVFFSAEAGGVLCGPCRGRAAPKGALLPGKAVKVLEELASLRAPPFPEAEPPPWRSICPDQKTLALLRTILGQMRVFLLERELQMVKYSVHLSP
jgi:DNA repair protein RecO (recombination protein O)